MTKRDTEGETYTRVFEQKTPRPQTDDEREAEYLSNNLHEMVPHLPEIILADINDPDKYIVKRKFSFQTDHPYSRVPMEIVPDQSPKISTPNQKTLGHLLQKTGNLTGKILKLILKKVFILINPIKILKITKIIRILDIETWVDL